MEYKRITYEQEDLKGALPNPSETEVIDREMGFHIAILQRGWVVVGDLFKSGSDYRMRNAAVIRNWGSTKGLGEIAIRGPTKKTILDKTPPLRFHEQTVVAFMICESDEWKKKLES